MPNRIIKESIRTSKKINAMTDFQFRLWVSLITYVDDYGRGSADPDILKGFVFPLLKEVSPDKIQTEMMNLANLGLIQIYSVDGDVYFCFPFWGKHQRIRNARSKYPAPDDGEIIKNDNSPSIDSKSPTIVSVIQSNPILIQSNSKNVSQDDSQINELDQDVREAFESFIQMRKQIKRPLTERGIKIKLNKLKKWAEPYNDKNRYMIECIDRSTENNWYDIYKLENFEDGEKLKYDENKLLDDYSDYVLKEEADGKTYHERMTMDEFFKEWIKSNESG